MGSAVKEEGPDEITSVFPFLKALPERELSVLSSRIVHKSLANKQVLAREGRDCTHLPFVLSGTLRVYKVGESGKELTLYRIDRGESCILSATCILNRGPFPAIAEAEGAVRVALIPAGLFADLVERSGEWRRYLFDLYSRRLDVLFTVVEEVAFHHVDARIAAYLLSSVGRGGAAERGGAAGRLSTAAALGPAQVPGGSSAGRPALMTASATHQGIASEVGTSREVVSRILKDFEAEGLVSIARGEITILKPEGLRAVAGSSSDV